MEHYHKFEVGEEVYLIRNDKLTSGIVKQINIVITKDKIGIKKITTNYYVFIKGYGNLYMTDEKIYKSPEDIIHKMKKKLKK